MLFKKLFTGIIFIYLGLIVWASAALAVDTGIESVEVTHYTDVIILLGNEPELQPTATNVVLTRTINGIADDSFSWVGGSSSWNSQYRTLTLHQLDFFPGAEYQAADQTGDSLVLDVRSTTQTDYSVIEAVLDEAPAQTPNSSSFLVQRLLNGQVEAEWSRGYSSWNQAEKKIKLNYLIMNGNYSENDWIAYRISYAGKTPVDTDSYVFEQAASLQPIQVNAIERVETSKVQVTVANVDEGTAPNSGWVIVERYSGGQQDSSFVWKGGLSSWNGVDTLTLMGLPALAPGESYVVRDKPEHGTELVLGQPRVEKRAALQIRLSRSPAAYDNLDMQIRRAVDGVEDDSFLASPILYDPYLGILQVDEAEPVAPAALARQVIYYAAADAQTMIPSEAYWIAPLADAAPPLFEMQPEDVSVALGGSLTLHASARSTDGGTLSFQWYSSAAGETTGGTALPGATEPMLELPTDVSGVAYYYLVVSNNNQLASGNQTAQTVSRAARVVIGETRYTVTFDSQGGGVLPPITVSEGGYIPAQLPIEKAGYLFGGWRNGSASASAPLWNFSADTVNADMILYAVWLPLNNGGGADGFWQPVGGGPVSTGWAAYESLAWENGIAYLVYLEGDNGSHATVMKYSGSGWEAVGASPGFPVGEDARGAARPVSMAVYEGTPYVAYRDSLHDGRAAVKKFDGTSWMDVGSSVFSTGEINSISLAISGGTPYVAYQESGAGKVLRYNGTGWVTVGSAFLEGYADNISLRVVEGTPYVAYTDTGNGGKAAVKAFDGSQWQPLGNPFASDGYASHLSLDFSGVIPYIAYRDGANGQRATVSRFNGQSWEKVGQAGFSAGQADDLSLTVYSGTPYVAYRDQANGEKSTVMRFDGSAWSPLGSAGFSPGYADNMSLAVTADGTVYIAYRDGTNSFRATVMEFASGQENPDLPVVEGNPGPITIGGSSPDLSLTVNLKGNRLTGIFMDGSPVPQGSYTLGSAAAVFQDADGIARFRKFKLRSAITLKKGYLTGLAPADHQLQLQFSDGSAISLMIKVQ
ncbi:MAG: hypothetical protein K0R57_4200 [Paenibacillaceae bacterium]|jgi:hypothetical protein|nr:hypothetical protein [Paenibacillaceae bacterium]